MGATVSRHLLGLFLSLALPWPAAHAAPASAPAPGAIAISFADEPARLVRDKGFYRAGRGVVLRENDMLEAGGGALQLGAGGTTIALGPAARIFVGPGKELILLDGWLKLRGAADQPFTAATSGMRLASAGSTVTLHLSGSTTELFAESGDTVVEERHAGKASRMTRVPQEQFAVRGGAAQPLQLRARPPAAFLAAMPPSFRDQLVPLAAGSDAAPKFERAATFAELAPWLAAQPALRRQVQARFQPPRAARGAPPRHPSPDLKATP